MGREPVEQDDKDGYNGSTAQKERLALNRRCALFLRLEEEELWVSRYRQVGKYGCGKVREYR